MKNSNKHLPLRTPFFLIPVQESVIIIVKDPNDSALSIFVVFGMGDSEYVKQSQGLINRRPTGGRVCNIVSAKTASLYPSKIDPTILVDVLRFDQDAVSA